jgi:hypothetical protein
MMALQRSAGNRAVTQLLARPVTQVQRLSVTSSQLDANLGESKAKGVLGLGVSTFASIRETLAAYEKVAQGDGPKDRVVQDKHLERLDRLCTRWINEHRSLTSEQDQARNRIVRSLVDEIPVERARRSRGRAQETYLDNLSAGQHSGGGVVPDTPFNFKSRSGGAAGAGANARDAYVGKNEQNWKLNSAASAAQEQRSIEERMSFVNAHGLSSAEHAAISTYTIDDYSYINAATANKPEWLKTARSQTKDTRAMMEEGALHTGVVHDGLAKLPPYKGTVYRGEAFDNDRFKEIRVGAYTFPHLTSTSKAQGTASGWAVKGRSGSRPNVVIWILPDSGGKDVEAISLTDGEREVLIAAGSKFTIRSVTEVDLTAPIGNVPTELSGTVGSLRATATKAQWDPAKVYLVDAVPATKQIAYHDVDDSAGSMRFARR